MILKTLSLTDFGTYAGTQSLDLTPVAGRPITLIGGTNGAGKTTLLDAILLCMHGRRALGPVGAREYEEHIRSRVHVPPAEGKPQSGRVAAVRLEFSYAEGGVPSEFHV
jgi:DNA sulfur modification protein DndD